MFGPMTQFGTFAPQGWRLEMRHIEGAAQQWETCRGVARKLESLGYDSLWLYDHFHTCLLYTSDAADE